MARFYLRLNVLLPYWLSKIFRTNDLRHAIIQLIKLLGRTNICPYLSRDVKLVSKRTPNGQKR